MLPFIASYRRAVSLLPLLTLTLLPASSATAQDGLKVYISADMEGVVGVVTSDHLGPTGWEYENARKWLTGEVNAAIGAARAAGAT
ncbi:MAG: M55 family metallopeptidase, partial [Longimicrobiales bacterium]|nr:M55 family metallopeptidase [Longimicrobiales bacterium]